MKNVFFQKWPSSGPVKTKISIFHVLFNEAISGRFFAFLKPMRNPLKQVSIITRNIEVKLQPNQKVLIFIGFLNVSEGLPEPGENRPKKSDNLKNAWKHRKTYRNKKTDFLTFFKRDTNREKVGERCFLKINTTRTNSPKTKEGGCWCPVKTKILIFLVFFNRPFQAFLTPY